MPTVSIQYEVQQSVPSEGVFSVQVQVVSTDFCELEIFTFDTEYSAFTGVATLYGMLNYPRTRGQAVTDGISYFRAVGVVRTFTEITKAEEFIAITKSRIEILRRDWQTYLDSFVSSETITTPAP